MTTATVSRYSHTGIEDSPAAQTWRRMEKASSEANTSTPGGGSDNQPDFIPLAGTSSDQHHPALLNVYPPPFSKHKRLLSGESTTTCTPWRTRDHMYTCDPPGLHEEIEDFFEYMRPRPSEFAMRSDVISRVAQIILSKWPQARVEVFGSFCTGLFLPTSDIDLVVLGNWMKLPLFSLEEEFKKAEIAIEGSILVLDKTTVPIIKFIDRLTEVKVDISFNQVTGMHCVPVIQSFIQQYPLLPKLVMVLKQFLTQRQLNEVYYGGISSYSLILLLVSFLQLHPRTSATDDTANVGVLLIEFFELYGRYFNYMKTGIDVTNGGSYFPKDEQLDPELSENSLLFIKDPISPTENASRGCYGVWQVKTTFEQAYLRLHSLVLSREQAPSKKDSLLSTIVNVSQEVDEYRNWVDSNWNPSTFSSTASATTGPYGYPVMHPVLPSFPLLPSFIPHVATTSGLEALTPAHFNHTPSPSSHSPPGSKSGVTTSTS